MFASESIQILMDKINPTVLESLNYMSKLNKNILETMERFFKNINSIIDVFPDSFNLP